MSESANKNESLDFDSIAKECGVVFNEKGMNVPYDMEPTMFKIFTAHYAERMNISDNVKFFIEIIFEQIESCKDFESIGKVLKNLRELAQKVG